ncbi:MAG: hypothetical protein R2695_01115 [Acidimicrobiales bacterium]
MARLASSFFERLDQLDEGQRVGVEVFRERIALVDARRLDLEDVGELVANDRQDLVATDRTLRYVCLCGHFIPPGCRNRSAHYPVAALVRL